jgi:hypothetical protein
MSAWRKFILYGAFALAMGTGSISMWATDSSAAMSADKVLVRFEVAGHPRTDRHPNRQVLVLNGRRLTGPMTVSYRNEILYINDERWLPRPGSVRRHTQEYQFLPPADSVRLLKVPFVARSARKGKPLLSVANDYYRRKKATEFGALKAYKDAKRRGVSDPIAAGIAQIDTSVAVTSGAQAPRFGDHEVDIYYPGYGWSGCSDYGEGTPPPNNNSMTSDFSAKALRLASLFSRSDRTVVVVLGASEMTLQGGERAELAADQIETLFGGDQSKSQLLAGTRPSGGLPSVLLKSIHAEMLDRNSHR